MEYRHLGRSELQVPVFSFGAGTFASRGSLFSAWGNTGVEEARRLLDAQPAQWQRALAP